MKIKVIHPFSLRLGSGLPVREFPVGEHPITQEEHDHWFMQACLNPKDGRAVLLADAGEDGSGELVSPTKEELMKLSREQLNELAASCGKDATGLASKADVCDLLLAGIEGVTLVKSPDAIYVEKAKAE